MLRHCSGVRHGLPVIFVSFCLDLACRRGAKEHTVGFHWADYDAVMYYVRACVLLVLQAEARMITATTPCFLMLSNVLHISLHRLCDRSSAACALAINIRMTPSRLSSSTTISRTSSHPLKSSNRASVHLDQEEQSSAGVWRRRGECGQSDARISW